MKPLAFVPPAIALIIGGVWTGFQRRSIARLDQQSLLLEKSIANARAAAQSEETASTSLSDRGSRTTGQVIDWKKIAMQVSTLNERSVVGDLRALMRLREQVSAMTDQELLTALDEIAALDLPKENRTAVENMIGAQLAEKAPEAFLTRFFNRMDSGNDPIGWQLSRALAAWAKDDPAATMRWLDRQIAAGAFDTKSLDGKNRARFEFEGTLVAALLSSDATAAKDRIAGLPPEHRAEALRYTRKSSMDAVATAYAAIVREQLPLAEQANALAEAAPSVSANDYGKVTDYMNRIAATSSEREACVEETGARTIQQLSYERDVKQEDIDLLRAWTAKEAPATMDRTTGKALASTLREDDSARFTQMAELALRYHESGGGDDLLFPLLDHWVAEQNPDTAKKLAARISDEKRRKKILRKFK